jgi:hypothetical protein
MGGMTGTLRASRRTAMMGTASAMMAMMMLAASTLSYSAQHSRTELAEDWTYGNGLGAVGPRAYYYNQWKWDEDGDLDASPDLPEDDTDNENFVANERVITFSEQSVCLFLF